MVKLSDVKHATPAAAAEEKSNIPQVKRVTTAACGQVNCAAHIIYPTSKILY